MLYRILYHPNVVGNELERHVLRWMAPRFGLDPEASAAHFISGGAETNLTGVLVALTRAFPEYGVRGLLAQPVFYVSAEAHHCFHKVAHLAGLGREALRSVPVDAGLKLDLGKLERRLAGRQPHAAAGGLLHPSAPGRREVFGPGAGGAGL